MHYDIAVIGGGPGGYVAALHAARLGKTVALIEAKDLGGTCLNRGCIPSKTWLKHAEIIESIEKAHEWGIETGTLAFSLAKMKQRKDSVIMRLRQGIAGLLRQEKIALFQGYGQVLPDGHTVEIVADGKAERITAERMIVATGSTPVIPPIEGLDSVHYETSDTIFDLAEIPASLTIIGGGVIGVELACIFAALKTEVTVIEMANQIIPSEDAEAAGVLRKQLQMKGIRFATGSKVDHVAQTGKMITVKGTDANGHAFALETASLLVCVGRKPNTSAVSQLPLAKNGPFIAVNDRMETSVPSVYAIGDVIGGYQLAHVASAEAIVAAANASGLAKTIGCRVVPRCIYTLPEVASVGISEQEAVKQGLSVKTARFDLIGNGKAISADEFAGFVKIVYEERFGEILGVTMVGPHVTEMISSASAYMFLEGTVEELAEMIHPHPTVSESLGELAQHILTRLKRKQPVLEAVN
ncbi:dihydrolipoyl dehydrogenase [Brevibacillus fulvus]|uniref:Dihydrolipoyl dehydrogenase n=1 Tax=Brevibacillus fulvus TaxID=1125967 RepID=A0A938Y4Z4_9BACL|nr:dihydrolipoyl dehydrogenase [Brevibacillus fulvus]MBM7591687.1 dihydrolipoamide dehydrogenase [Brevibacillus fulvus]